MFFILPVDCTCKVSIPLTTDTDSHGCNGGWVGQLGIPAMATVENGCGQFGGFDSVLNNGAHLGTYVIDGAFAGDWVNQLKLTAAFTLDSSWDNTAVDTKWGVVTYGNCAAESSFAFSVQKNSTDTYLVADLELMTVNGIEQYTLAVGQVRFFLLSCDDYGITKLYISEHFWNKVSHHFMFQVLSGVRYRITFVLGIIFGIRYHVSLFPRSFLG